MAEGGVIAVLGDETAEACIDLLQADGSPTCHLPCNLADDPGMLSERLVALCSRDGGVSGFIDVSEVPVGLTLGQYLTRQFLTTTAVGRILCKQGYGAYAALARRDGFPDPVDDRVACETMGMLVKTMACEWAPLGVRASAVISEADAGAVEMLAFLASDGASFATGSVVDI